MSVDLARPATVTCGGVVLSIPWHRGAPLLGVMRDLMPLYIVNDGGTKYCWKCEQFKKAGEFPAGSGDGKNKNPYCEQCVARSK